MSLKSLIGCVRYYLDSIEYMKRNVDNPTFFVFSNNIEWAKENLKDVKNIVYVENNDRFHGIGDMHLISFCKHNIISNSTFSWWSAVLNKNENKIVIAPKRWSEKKNVTNIWLKDWIRM